MKLSWRRTAIAAACVVMFAGVTYADSDWLTGKTEDQLKTLANIQPGVGTVMRYLLGLILN